MSLIRLTFLELVTWALRDAQPQEDIKSETSFPDLDLPSRYGCLPCSADTLRLPSSPVPDLVTSLFCSVMQ